MISLAQLAKCEEVTIYLIHLHTPITRSNGVKVQHYIGSTDNLPRRLGEHRRGKAANGSALLDLANQKRIFWSVVRTWKATRSFEYILKRQRNHKRFCPVCGGEIPF